MQGGGAVKCAATRKATVVKHTVLAQRQYRFQIKKNIPAQRGKSDTLLTSKRGTAWVVVEREGERTRAHDAVTSRKILIRTLVRVRVPSGLIANGVEDEGSMVSPPQKPKMPLFFRQARQTWN